QGRPMWRVLMDALSAWERREMGKELRNAIAELRTRARLSDSPEVMRGLPEIVRDYERASASVMVADNDARYVAVNEAAARLTGYSREELLVSTVWDITPPGDVADGKTAWRQFLKDGEFDGLYRLMRKDGSLVWVHSIAVAHLVRGLHVSALAEVSGTAIVAA